MNNDKKAGIRITIERVSVTTIRARSNKTYCEICRRSLDPDDEQLAPPASEPRKVIEAGATASATEKGKEK